ncbi:ribonuclease H family protein [Pontibacter sp. 13R65]|uniref:ribonuclease H family protein n=1 Tax=Pontibacter sp. 13R65 TaxID=3127458 RepID=UPI00301D0FD9
MGKQKFYVVWKGREVGVFESWGDCKKQIDGVKGALYKSFSSKELAEEALLGSGKDYINKNKPKSELTVEQKALIGDPILESISVDGAWNTATGIVEYQGVDTGTGKLLFRQGPFEDGTNNIVEFLAIVHGLAYCKKNGLVIPIYSDSNIAISWVRDKEVATHQSRSEKNKKLFDLIDRALKWLNINEYPNNILKWETKAWGENPADFGRK